MDVYKIAVNLAVSSNAPHFFAALSHQLAHVHTQVRDLHGSLNKVQVGLAGALSVGVGVGLITGLKKVTDHARELSKELATLKTFNLKPIEIKQAQETARRTTTVVPGSTESGNLKILAESYSLFGMENAKKINEPLARAAQVFGAIDGNYKGAQETLYSLLKSGEMMGKLVDEKTHQVSPEKLIKYLDVVSKVAAATGNKVNAQTLFGIAQQGAPAMANMSDDGLMSVMMAAQAMGGMRAGTAMTSLYQQFIGGTMTKDKAEKLHELGLVGDFTSARGGVKWKKGALDTDFARQLADNPLDAMKTLMARMEEHGIKGTEAQTKYLFQILGRQTTQRIVNDFVRNLPQMMQEQGRIKGAQGLEDQAKTRNAEDYGTAEHNMHSAWENLMEAIAGPNAKAAIGIMNAVSGGLNQLTEAVRGTNPDTIVAIAKGIGVFGLSLIGAGAVAIMAALGPAGWLVLGIGALAGAMVAVDPKNFTQLSMFWALAKSEAIILNETLKGFVFDPKTLTMVSSTWATTKDEFAGLVVILTKAYEWYSVVLGWRQKLQDLIFGALGGLGGGVDHPGMSESAREGLREREVDPMGVFVTKLLRVFTDLDKVLMDGSNWLAEEIKTWPARLAGAIAEMGSGLVSAIGTMLKNLFASLNPFSKTSYEGGGGGLGGMIQNASFGGSGGFTGGYNGGGAGGYNGGGFSGSALPVGSGNGIGHVASQADRAAYIRAAAAARGIDPEVALRVAQSEGFNQYVGDHGASFGDWQLFTGGGLGNQALAAGINIRDPSTWKAQTDFALDYAKRNGWGSWHGARKVGIGDGVGLNYTGGLGGLRVKGAQATAGGGNAPALQVLAAQLQKAGGLNRVTAFNDRYHAGTGSMHARGLAMDLTGDPAALMGNARALMEAAGMAEGRDYRMINEYARRSKRWTGGHVHFEFRSREAAEAYQAQQRAATAPPPRTAGPPPAQGHTHNIEVPVHVAGHRVAHVVHRVMTASARHPTSAGQMDTRGSWRPPGTDVIDSA